MLSFGAASRPRHFWQRQAPGCSMDGHPIVAHSLDPHAKRTQGPLEIRDRERLLKICRPRVGSRFRHPCEVVVARREHNGQLVPAMTDQPAECEPVEIRQRDIDDDRVGLVVVNQPDHRPRQVRVNDLMPFIRQAPREPDGDDRIIFDEK